MSGSVQLAFIDFATFSPVIDGIRLTRSGCFRCKIGAAAELSSDVIIALSFRAIPFDQSRRVRISSGAPLRYRTGHAKTCRFCAFSGDERAQKHAFRPYDAQLFLVDFDALGERAKVIAAVATAIGSHPLAGCPGKGLEGLWRDGRAGAINRFLGPLCVKAGLIARGHQFTDAVLQQGIGEIGDAVLDGVVKPLEFGVCLSRPLAQFGDMRLSSLGALGATIEYVRQKPLKTLGLQQTLLDVLRDQIVEFFHRDGATRTAGLPLPGFGATGVVAVTAALAGAQRHRSTTRGAKADAGKEGRAADDSRCDHRWAPALEQHLDGLKFLLVDDCRHRHFHDFSLRLALAGLPELGIETVAADVARPGQHFVDSIDTPASAVAGADAASVEMRRDGLDAHRSRASVALARQAEDQAHGLSLDRVDLQGLLRPVAALLVGLHDPIADRR